MSARPIPLDQETCRTRAAKSPQFPSCLQMPGARLASQQRLVVGNWIWGARVQFWEAGKGAGVCGGPGVCCRAGPTAVGAQMCSSDPSEWRGACRELPRALGVRSEASLPPASPCRPPPACHPEGRSDCAHTGFLLESALWLKEGRGPRAGSTPYGGEQSVPLGFPTEERCTRKQDRTALCSQASGLGVPHGQVAGRQN